MQKKGKEDYGKQEEIERMNYLNSGHLNGENPHR
jgi:hypothetical protein